MVLLDVRFSTHDLNVFNQGDVNLFCQVDSLEKVVVLLLFVQVAEDYVLVENAILDEHQSLDVL
jgi:hypothetical protein